MKDNPNDNNDTDHEIMRMIRVIMIRMMMTNEGFDHTLCYQF